MIIGIVLIIIALILLIMAFAKNNPMYVLWFLLFLCIGLSKINKEQKINTIIKEKPKELRIETKYENGIIISQDTIYINY